MNRRESFDEALDRAIDALRRGEGLDRVLARHPRHADALRPLLETAQQALAGRPAVAAAMSPRLAENFSIVRAAVQRAQMAAQPVPMRPEAAPRTPWWQRRLAFASLSLPAGAAALLLLAGATGAAASVALTGNTDLPAGIVNLIKEPQRLVGGGGGNQGGGTPSAGRGADGQATAGAGSAATAAADASATPGSTNAPTNVTLDGTISDVRGNVFTLTTGDGAYKVNIDATTTVTGTIADGAQATVVGDVTAEKNLHATTVTVGGTSGPQPSTGAGTGTPGPQSDRTPGPPADKTAGPPVTLTPGPPPGRTPPGQGDGGPPVDHTPPGQSGGAGNRGGGGNGNAEGNVNAGGNGNGNGNTQGSGNGNAGSNGNGNGNGGGSGKP